MPHISANTSSFPSIFFLTDSINYQKMFRGVFMFVCIQLAEKFDDRGGAKIIWKFMISLSIFLPSPLFLFLLHSFFFDSIRWLSSKSNIFRGTLLNFFSILHLYFHHFRKIRPPLTYCNCIFSLLSAWNSSFLHSHILLFFQTLS